MISSNIMCNVDNSLIITDEILLKKTIIMVMIVTENDDEMIFVTMWLHAVTFSNLASSQVTTYQL